MQAFVVLFKWSEVWASLLPLLVLVFRKEYRKSSKPVTLYLCFSLLTYIVADTANLIYFNNNFLYNILSIIRLYFFIWFFAVLKIITSKRLLYFIRGATIVLIVLNFLMFESFRIYSSRLFTLEGIVLITFCIRYFLLKLKSDEIASGFDASLYIITGLAIYEAISFPIFLTYNTLVKEDTDFAIHIWYIHDIAYIVFCLFIVRAFYGTVKHYRK